MLLRKRGVHARSAGILALRLFCTIPANAKQLQARAQSPALRLATRGAASCLSLNSYLTVQPLPTLLQPRVQNPFHKSVHNHFLASYCAALAAIVAAHAREASLSAAARRDVRHLKAIVHDLTAIRGVLKVARRREATAAAKAGRLDGTAAASSSHESGSDTSASGDEKLTTAKLRMSASMRERVCRAARIGGASGRCAACDHDLHSCVCSDEGSGSLSAVEAAEGGDRPHAGQRHDRDAQVQMCCDLRSSVRWPCFAQHGQAGTNISRISVCWQICTVSFL